VEIEERQHGSEVLGAAFICQKKVLLMSRIQESWGKEEVHAEHR
jgi:hypothetical protein